MRPAKPDAAVRPDMFRETLEAILDPKHALPELGRRIDREKLDAACGATFIDQVGRPGPPTRPMAGPHILKHVKGLSDEAVCAAWVENPYFQAFCGERFFSTGGQFVLGAKTLPGNPYYGHSLAAQIDQVARLTGRPVQRAYVDRGYRGHGVAREGLQVVVSHTRGITSPTIRREMRRRNAIEPVLGHMKTDGLLEGNHLHGPEGDAVNSILCAIGHNCRLLLAWFTRLLACLITTAPCIAAEILRAIIAIMQPRPARHIQTEQVQRVLHGRRTRNPS